MPMRLRLTLKYIVLIEVSQIVSRWSAGRWAAKHSSALRLKPCAVRLNESLPWPLGASGML
jgi:hypothetical protein